MFDLIEFANKPSRFSQNIAARIWADKYQYKTAEETVDMTLDDTFRRVASGLAAVEPPSHRDQVFDTFIAAMDDFRVLPAGRILSGCNTARHVTLSNTFVMRTLPDSVSGIMDVVKEAALTMKMGGGIGFDFSTIRPKGHVVNGLDCPAAGPLAAMDICDAVCKMIVSGMGRGAMMATMRCDHPDIVAFVAAKSDRTRLRSFNMSVLVTDAFMEAVHDGVHWDLCWNGEVIETIDAAALWDAIMGQNYGAAEPGVLFIDRMNALNPLNYLESVSATNSCAEQPLPPNGTCPLTAINLSQLVFAPFTPAAKMDMHALKHLTGVAVRMLDNALDVSLYPLPAQRKEAQDKRRIGVGVTGVADALAMLGVTYGSSEAERLVGDWMQALQNAAYEASALLAKERGAFPLYDAERHLAQPMIQKLYPEVRDLIAQFGLRNGTLTTIAPTGTISMLAGNVSSGIEPIFATHFNRTITAPDGTKGQEKVCDYAVWLFHQMFGHDAELPTSFVTAADLSPQDHIRMQAAAQQWVDSGISKTVNCPEDIPFDAFKEIYLKAYASGCKGCTTYRPNDVTGSVLSI